LKEKLLALALLFALNLVVVFSAGAQTANDSLIGIISASRDASGAITGATLEAETYDDNDNVLVMVYRIEMDDIGKKLAEEYDGAEVKVTGLIKSAAEGAHSKDKTIVVAAYESLVDDIPSEPVDDGSLLEIEGQDIDFVGDEPDETAAPAEP
jgi:hypothetical protein